MPLQDLVTSEKPIPLFVEKCVQFIEDTGKLGKLFQENFPTCRLSSASHLKQSLEFFAWNK